MSDRVVAVCLQKSGTHLLASLMKSMRLQMCGAVRPDPAIPYSRLSLSEADYERFAHVACGSDREKIDRFKREDPDGLYEIWLDIFWSWRTRLGVPLLSRYGQGISSRGREAAERWSQMRFSDTPEGLCWFVPSLGLSRLDGSFIDEWTATSSPKLIFNVRDPRDMLVSFVDYLLNKTKFGVGTYHEYKVYSEILSRQESYERQLLYAIRDPSFPGKQALRESLWLIAHPRVLTVRFEDLAGARAGGSDERQVRAVRRVTEHIGGGFDVNTLARSSYDEGVTAQGVRMKFGSFRGSARLSA